MNIRIWLLVALLAIMLVVVGSIGAMRASGMLCKGDEESTQGSHGLQPRAGKDLGQRSPEGWGWPGPYPGRSGTEHRGLPGPAAGYCGG
jgi:hypothetical protein